ncbi:helix-turn-helix transcriptional regulator [Streptomyces lavenduligriseus]|uniref:Helix-turn-helix domain-containing protein n=1 Tax=Streptomyces lavenduligriseus TaxID=67315 RepID=A0ABT0NTB0_9ACTN|nr:helix-turn-helix domain-containing protein [Streptomyces lavenduligriseus]MCL3994715.1 helix-turn-helix domain-containing protein [Streptomyces lavenduligriseus]
MTDEDSTFDMLAVLGDPVRRRLYRYVAAAPEDVGRDAAAEAAGISRSLAAFHLDKLVEAGLLTVSFRRLSGRTGPGAGRPAKLYRRAEGEHVVSVPPRSYEAVGRLLAEVLENAGLDRELQAAARAAGAARPDGHADDVEAALRARGYEPFWDGETLRLRNCPYHALASEFPALICGMNLALIEGLAPEQWSPTLDPCPGGCCVALSKKKSH